MGRIGSFDLRRAWNVMQERGMGKSEIMRLIGYQENSGTTGLELLFERNGLLTWTDETGKLHAYRSVDRIDE